MLDKLANLDRRWVYLLILLSVVVPLLFPLNLKIATSKPVEDIYNFIENLPAGSTILVCFDCSPSTDLELTPSAEAVIRHAFQRDLKVLILGMWPEGPQMAQKLMDSLSVEYNAKYGVDYVNLGYKAGGSVLLVGLKSGFVQQFPVDYYGTPITDLPLMNKVKTFNDCDLVMDISAGIPGIREHIMIVNSQFGRPLAGAVTAVTAPEMYSFLNSGQLLGLMGGLKGAAEYEMMLNYRGNARKSMDAQSIAHLVIVIFIIFANVLYFVQIHRERQG